MGKRTTSCLPVPKDIAPLALERIRSIDVLDETFIVDPNFDPKRYKTEAFGVAWEKPSTVVVRFRADQAPYVREREWHPTQRLRNLPDGRVELTFRAGGTFEIMRWILGWGDAVEVVRPASLRREVLAILRSASAGYSQHRPGRSPWHSVGVGPMRGAAHQISRGEI